MTRSHFVRILLKLRQKKKKKKPTPKPLKKQNKINFKKSTPKKNPEYPKRKVRFSPRCWGSACTERVEARAPRRARHCRKGAGRGGNIYITSISAKKIASFTRQREGTPSPAPSSPARCGASPAASSPERHGGPGARRGGRRTSHGGSRAELRLGGAGSPRPGPFAAAAGTAGPERGSHRRRNGPGSGGGCWRHPTLLPAAGAPR